MSYEPRPIPDMHERELRGFLSEELRRISDSVRNIESIMLPELNVAVKRPRDGMIILADGTNYNPGSGAGFYGRVNGVWVLMS